MEAVFGREPAGRCVAVRDGFAAAAAACGFAEVDSEDAAGIRTTVPHLHLACLPALSSGTRSVVLQDGHWNWIGIVQQSFPFT